MFAEFGSFDFSTPTHAQPARSFAADTRHGPQLATPVLGRSVCTSGTAAVCVEAIVSELASSSTAAGRTQLSSVSARRDATVFRALLRRLMENTQRHDRTPINVGFYFGPRDFPTATGLLRVPVQMLANSATTGATRAIEFGIRCGLSVE